MQPPHHHHHHHSRINLADLKAQMVKKLGPEGSKQYFYCLTKFLSLKLTKVEFNKLCLRIIGRDNLPLHNQLIRSILRNACTAESPPPANAPLDGYRLNGSLGLSNGVDRRIENGDLHPFVGRSANGNETMIGRLLEGQASTRSDLRAPLGVQFCPGPQRTKPPPSSWRCTGTVDDHVLFDNLTLKELMEQISAARGLEGVSMDSANILNIALDSYMKGLIKSCIEFSGSRSSHNLMKNKLHNCTKPINGVRPGYQHPMQELKAQRAISFQDFRVAMELNPQKLGANWPLLLEKICTQAFHE
ncbi:uncharacterized protein LOC127239780 [Andrographis paniculata]|uniref:uncharacterized protein LOC127239780 n=1 Tax=Andrographis paniculata TaxID=175694 RepID=UPI0021E7F95E|nr:uncharacterized protein LOC127239780 [Andrographis paniculata]